MSQLKFLIKYGSEEQKDKIMDMHADNLHIFKHAFQRTMLPLTDKQKDRIKKSVHKFERGDADPVWRIATITKDPELHDYFASDYTYHEHLAGNKHIQKKHIDVILDSPNVPAHESLTTRKDLAPEHIEILSKHSDPDVRNRLIDNHRDRLTPEQMKSAKQTGYLKIK